MRVDNLSCAVAPLAQLSLSSQRTGRPSLLWVISRNCVIEQTTAEDWQAIFDLISRSSRARRHGAVHHVGPPVEPKRSENRLHLDIGPPRGDDQQVEVERLVALGATRIEIGQGDVSWVVMADPGGNEFCVLTPR